MTRSKKDQSKLEFYIDSGIDLDRRTIMLDSEIDVDSVGIAIRAIHKMVEISDEKPIDIYINSEGGSIYDGFALYDTIEECPCLVRTHAIGSVMSIALIIYLAGDERYSKKRATFMNHKGSDRTKGTVDQIGADYHEIKRIEDVCYDILAEKTKRTRAWWKSNTHVESKFYNKEQALKLGIVTHE